MGPRQASSVRALIESSSTSSSGLSTSLGMGSSSAPSRRRRSPFCAGRVNRLATRFAAKEAVAKVLGTGFRGLGWQEVEVLTSPHGEPHVVLHDRARKRADHLGMRSIGVSLTHTTVAAEAFVVALCTGPAAEQSIREETDHG